MEEEEDDDNFDWIKKKNHSWTDYW
jgi:hypothetical protein